MRALLVASAALICLGLYANTADVATVVERDFRTFPCCSLEKLRSCVVDPTLPRCGEESGPCSFPSCCGDEEMGECGGNGTTWACLRPDERCGTELRRNMRCGTCAESRVVLRFGYSSTVVRKTCGVWDEGCVEEAAEWKEGMKVEGYFDGLTWVRETRGVWNPIVLVLLLPIGAALRKAWRETRLRCVYYPLREDKRTSEDLCLWCFYLLVAAALLYGLHWMIYEEPREWVPAVREVVEVREQHFTCCSTQRTKSCTYAVREEVDCKKLLAKREVGACIERKLCCGCLHPFWDHCSAGNLTYPCRRYRTADKCAKCVRRTDYGLLQTECGGCAQTDALVRIDGDVPAWETTLCGVDEIGTDCALRLPKPGKTEGWRSGDEWREEPEIPATPFFLVLSVSAAGGALLFFLLCCCCCFDWGNPKTVRWGSNNDEPE